MNNQLTQKERQEQRNRAAAKHDLAHVLLNLENNTDAELRERLQQELQKYSEILESL